MKKLFAALFLLFFIACKGKDDLPKGILSKDKMEGIMWDMMRSTEFLNTFVFQKDTTLDRTVETQKWYDKIYATNQVTREQFEKSYTYYKAHPLLMRDLMDSISKKQVNATSEESRQETDTNLPPPAVDTAKSVNDNIGQPDSSVKKELKLMIDTVMRRRVELKKQ